MIALNLSEELRDDLPASAKLVLLVLRGADRPVDLDELAERTQLPKETVRRRCHELIEHDLASKRPSFRDARQNLFSATSQEPPPPESGTSSR